MNNALLSLKTNLGDCPNKHSSKCDIKSSFEIISSEQFCVYDDIDIDDCPAKIVSEAQTYQLQVFNPNKVNICFVKTDKCLFKNKLHKRCDCVLFSEDKIFFVELTNTNKQKGRKRNDAADQLLATICIFKECGIDLSSKTCEAIICFKSAYPKIPIASQCLKKIKFNEYNALLKEGQKIYF